MNPRPDHHVHNAEDRMFVSADDRSLPGAFSRGKAADRAHSSHGGDYPPVLL